jgi:hypothetical protein
MEKVVTSPINAFLEWWRSLPVPHRQEIATYVVEFNPGYEGVDAFELDTLIDEFEKKLKGYSENKFLGVGVALSLRTTIEFFLIRKRGSRKGWQNSRHYLDGAKQHFATEGKDWMVESINRCLQEFPFKEEQWIATNIKWKQLIDAQLSDEYIDKWWRMDQ